MLQPIRTQRKRDWLRLGGILTPIEAGNFPCAHKDAGEHRPVEAAGVGIAQRRMVTAQEIEAVWQKIFGSVGEFVIGSALYLTGCQQVSEKAIPGNLSQTDDDADAGERFDFGCKVGRAVANLLRGGLVARWSTADDGTDPGVAEAEVVVARDGLWLRGESELMQNGVHEVSGTVASEGPSGAISTMSSGSKAENEYPGAWISEAGHRFGPVDLVAIGRTARLANTLAVSSQAGTELTGDDILADGLQDDRQGLGACDRLRGFVCF